MSRIAADGELVVAVVNLDRYPFFFTDDKGELAGSDIDLAKTTLRELLRADERVLNDPAPLIVLSELADNSVNFTVRAWAATGAYWGVYFDMQESVKKRFDAVGLEIPFPQRDVHLHTVSS